MNGGSHHLEGFSSFPFIIFQSYWPKVPFIPNRKKDTLIGNDVWIGYDATIMPGVSIGDGAIIGTRAMVAKLASEPSRTKLRDDAHWWLKFTQIGVRKVASRGKDKIVLTDWYKIKLRCDGSAQ
ncbi:MAG: hypothetical protein ACHP65_07725 [Legionellales bacterium]